MHVYLIVVNNYVEYQIGGFIHRLEIIICTKDQSILTWDIIEPCKKFRRSDNSGNWNYFLWNTDVISSCDSREKTHWIILVVTRVFRSSLVSAPRRENERVATHNLNVNDLVVENIDPTYNG